MVTYEEIEVIFSKISEEFNEPIPIGGRCESTVYYRTEELTEEDLNKCAEYVVDRIMKVTSTQLPSVFLKLPGGYSFFAERLCAIYNEWVPNTDEVDFEHYSDADISNGLGDRFKGRNTILVTDVITTAKSSLEAHTKATLRGIPILCWATLIDRTFGPGPVPVVAAYTGSPVRVLTNIG